MKLGKFSQTILLTLSVVIAVSFCFAEGDHTITVMTLEEAVNYAMSNNANVIDLERMEEEQEDTYKKAEKTYRIWQSKSF